MHGVCVYVFLLTIACGIKYFTFVCSKYTIVQNKAAIFLRTSVEVFVCLFKCKIVILWDGNCYKYTLI